MTPNARATAHQRVPVGRCGVALPVFPKNSQIFIIARGIITVNTVFRLDNCVLIPHIGSATIQTRTRMATLTAANIISGIRNEKMPSELYLGNM